MNLHPGEEFFSLGTPDVLIFGLLLVATVLMIFANRFPSVQTVREYIHLLNSRGGNIAVLLAMSLYFFVTAMRLFYHAISLTAAGHLKAENAVLLMAVQFVVGTAFGGSFGALMKTMTGSDSAARAGESRNGKPEPPPAAPAAAAAPEPQPPGN